MKVLVACESSGEVRRAFRAVGHQAFSCDLLPADDGSPYHFQADALEVARCGKWDMMIAHPPCTHLASSGARWLTDHMVANKKTGDWWHDGTAKREAQKLALAFVRALWDCPIHEIAIENPVGVLSSSWMPPTQYVQPWWFGHGETKKTGLWLKNLPMLSPTHIVGGREQRIWKMAPGPERWKERSKTYPGLAKAMAEQWGNKTEEEGYDID